MNAMGVSVPFTALALALLLLPLERFTTLGLSRGSWNGWEIFFGGVFCGAWLLLARFHLWPSRHSIQAALLASGVLSVAALGSLASIESISELVRLLVVVWTLPVISLLRDRVGRFRLLSLLMLIVSMQAVWGVSQFALQHGLGWHWIGETAIDVHTPGVAKFSLDGSVAGTETKLIRAYGPFPHANSYGGTLVLGVVAAISVYFFSRRRERAWFMIVLALLMMGVLVSFSRAAAISMLLLLAVIFLFDGPLNTFWRRRLWLLLSVVLLVFVPLFSARMRDGEDVARSERVQGVQWAWQILEEGSLWRGSGMGQYEKRLRAHLKKEGVTYTFWQIEPVHNAVLLVAVEWGVVVTIGFLLVGLWWWVRSWWHLGLLLALLPLFILDHYLVTQTGSLLALLTLLVGLAPARSRAPRRMPGVLDVRQNASAVQP